MSRHTKPPTTDNAALMSVAAVFTLTDVLYALRVRTDLSGTRRRDLQSAVTRVAAFLGEAPNAVPLNMSEISAKLAKLSPAALEMSAKTFANIRANFMAAITISGLVSSVPGNKTVLSPAWAGLMAKLLDQRAKLGLSRLAHYASAVGLTPGQINDQVINDFLASVRQGSLHRKPNDLHRQTTRIWNEVGQDMKELGLVPVTVPSFRLLPQRVNWSTLTGPFRRDVEAHLEWCAGKDVFAADARTRPLSPRTIKLRRDQIHAAVSALVASGAEVSSITALADLVTADNFKRILRYRCDAADGRANSFDKYLAAALVQIAREWVKTDAATLAVLKKMVAKVPSIAPGLTDKNKRFLRQFDDPKAFVRMLKLPRVLWSEVRRARKPNFRTLAKAQAALAVMTLIYMPIRLRNLASLAFGTHIFLNDDVRATSTLELPPEEVKSQVAIGFDIPAVLAKMLIEYRDRIAPAAIGRRPEHLFVNIDGSPKSPATVAWLIRTSVRKGTGIVLSAHQFRHLGAKVLLDADPGNFETVKQSLGHRNIKTTTNYYTGIDSRRAGRHHQRLIDQALNAQSRPKRSRKKPPSKPKPKAKA